MRDVVQEYVDKFDQTECPDDILQDKLNHYLKGSGWDTKWYVDQLKNGKYRATIDFHCMDEHGGYNGYITINVTILPDLSDFTVNFNCDTVKRRKYVTGNRDFYETEIYNALEKIRKDFS